MEVSRVDDSFRPTPQHDLFDHMGSVTRQLAEDYARIRKNATDDAGTAGDAAEESWAEFLRNWLPPSYYVTTKGRILAADGREGPQVDVVVFYPWYSRLSRVWQTDVFSSETWAAAARRKRQLLPDQLASRFEPRRDAIWDEWNGIDWLPQRQSGT